ncbi:methyltransferase domain-containing protein [Dactylosporangium sp. NPDC050588]|uniref:methyltransferase domain-containing protein n=1 Tax=Dactylosporangium sp. NPDC050588 TaxID=3157211 RepID=UPI0033E7061F
MAHELWAKGDAYEAYVGRWSRPVAARFLTWLAVPPGRRWLDAGCGTGALTGTILTTATPAQLTGLDPSTAFLTTASSRLTPPPATSPTSTALDRGGPEAGSSAASGASPGVGSDADAVSGAALGRAGSEAGSGAASGASPGVGLDTGTVPGAALGRAGSGAALNSAGSGAGGGSDTALGPAGAGARPGVASSAGAGPEAAFGPAGVGPGSGAAWGAAPGARFVAGDAQALPLADAAVDVVVSGLALNFVPSPAAAVAEFARVTAPGGTVAAYVWDYADGMAMMRHFWEAAATLDPAAAELDEGRRMSICSPTALSALWSAAGLTAVTTRPIDTTAVFADFDDYWTPFLGGTGPAPSYVASLPSDHRDALRDLLRARLPHTADGSIPLLARALAIRGTAR